MESMPLASREEADGINTSLALISSQSYEHAALRLDIDSRVLLDIRKGHGIEKHLPGSVNAQLVQALTQQIINPYLIYGRRVLAFLREPHRGLDVSALHLPQRPPPNNPAPHDAGRAGFAVVADPFFRPSRDSFPCRPPPSDKSLG
jgi:hypothetical protein